MPNLKALSGRVILKFPPPAEEVKGGIIIPERSRQRPEFGEIFDIGSPLDEEQEQIYEELADLKESGRRIAVSFASGTHFGVENQGSEWAWINDYRAYRITELSCWLEE